MLENFIIVVCVDVAVGSSEEIFVSEVNIACVTGVQRGRKWEVKFEREARSLGSLGSPRLWGSPPPPPPPPPPPHFVRRTRRLKLTQTIILLKIHEHSILLLDTEKGGTITVGDFVRGAKQGT